MKKFLLDLSSTNADIVLDKVHDQRLDICNKCENLNDNRCIICGCLVKHLSAFKISSCPINKW